MELVRVLGVYKKAARQEVNLNKSGIMFSKNTSRVERQSANDILNIQRSMEHDTYLGLPLMFGRCKARELRYYTHKFRVEIKTEIWSQIIKICTDL